MRPTEPALINQIILLIANPARGEHLGFFSCSAILCILCFGDSWLDDGGEHSGNQLRCNLGEFLKSGAEVFVVGGGPDDIAIGGFIFQQEP